MAALLAGAIAGAAAVPAGKQAMQSWLYVLDAEAARADGEQLVLVNVDPIAVGFSDRPQRLVARFTVSELIASWEDLGLGDDPPNAALSWFDDEGEHTIVVELSQPSESPEGLSFTYRELERTPKRLRSGSATRQPDLPSEFREVVVFIDHLDPTAVNPQITD